MKAEMAQLQQSAVHNRTAAMLEMGTNLLSQTAEQTRKLTDVETQVSPPMKLPTQHLLSYSSHYQLCRISIKKPNKIHKSHDISVPAPCSHGFVLVFPPLLMFYASLNETHRNMVMT